MKPFTITAKSPINTAIPERLLSIGDHLRKKRLEAGLRLRDLEPILGVNHKHICSWELGHKFPSLQSISKILKFLGYDPRQEKAKTIGQLNSKSLKHALALGIPAPDIPHIGDLIWKKRMEDGITQEQLAKILKLRASTISKYEWGHRVPSLFVSKKIHHYLGLGQRMINNPKRLGKKA